MTPREAAGCFVPPDQVDTLVPLGSGNINDTWLLQLTGGEKRVLQRLNPMVFKEPQGVIRNMHLVTAHLHERLHGRAAVCTMIPARDGKYGVVDTDGSCWRLLTYIDRTRCLNRLNNEDQAREIGRMLGLFHYGLADLDPRLLTDPLPGFHDTPAILARYHARLARSKLKCQTEQNCQRFIEVRRELATVLDTADHQGKLRRQVVHGDPKVANFLFAESSDSVISLIDLDTVRAGLLLHDLGDCLRSACNTAGEEVTDPEAIVFDRKMFHAVLAGYFSRAGTMLQPGDREHLVTSARVLAFELGIRFFTDHLAGNHYFKVQYEQQNLLRARIQFALVRSMEEQEQDLRECVASLSASCIPQSPALGSLP
ncbi:phosphotransferase enzyme family protein [Desulfolithobacter sp.]